MKKIILTLALILGACSLALAVPAKPGKITVTQPDGSTIVIQLHGDEFFHWATDEKGRVVEQDENGFYRVADMAKFNRRRAEGELKRRSFNKGLRGIWSSYDNQRATNFGDRKILVLLANFSDTHYVIDNPNTSFSNMLNQDGYSYNGTVGSVREYFIDNSLNQYRPHFDVYGPVQLTKTSAEYKESGVVNAIREAYDLLKNEININDYDTDNDGNLDMVLFYFPGYNEAEGGGSTTIWPHMGNGSYGQLGGKNLIRYFCTSELSGGSGANMSSIGTTCHEFSHALGIPDLYDVDGDSNGRAEIYFTYLDLMGSGNYNADGKCPPYLSSNERYMLGWMPMPSSLSAGDYTLSPLRNNNAYISPTGTSGEYFILECRDNYKWDSALPEHGLVVFHIDKSNNIVSSTTTASYIWENTNSINAYAGHPCYYVLTTNNNAHYALPGTGNFTTMSFVGWDGNSTEDFLTNIAFNGSSVSFTNSKPSGRIMYGNVRDTDGNPVEGATVVVSQSKHKFSMMLSTDSHAETDANGYYSFTLPSTASDEQIIIVHKEGYVSSAINVPVNSQFIRQDYTLYRKGEGELLGFHRYDSSLNRFQATWSWEEHQNVGAAIYYPASELTEIGAAGSQLRTISFMTYPTVYDNIYVVVDIDGQRALLRDVTSSFVPGKNITTVDVTDANIILPANKDVYIGYGITNTKQGDPMVMGFGWETEWNNGCYTNKDFLTSSNWAEMKGYGDNNYINLIISFEVTASIPVTFSDMGIAYVKEGAGGTLEVVPPAGKTVYSTQWFRGGSLVTDTTPSGSYMVRLTYYDGTSERVYYQK